MLMALKEKEVFDFPGLPEESKWKDILSVDKNIDGTSVIIGCGTFGILFLGTLGNCASNITGVTNRFNEIVKNLCR
jgi:hypothetical protein